MNDDADLAEWLAALLIVAIIATLLGFVLRASDDDEPTPPVPVKGT